MRRSAQLRWNHPPDAAAEGIWRLAAFAPYATAAGAYFAGAMVIRRRRVEFLRLRGAPASDAARMWPVHMHHRNHLRRFEVCSHNSLDTSEGRYCFYGLYATNWGRRPLSLAAG